MIDGGEVIVRVCAEVIEEAEDIIHAKVGDMNKRGLDSSESVAELLHMYKINTITNGIIVEMLDSHKPYEKH